MNRLFGAKSNAPKPTLNSAISNLETKVDSLDITIAKLNSELSTITGRMGKMRDGPGKNALRQKAKKLLLQRKKYESQKEQLETQAWNMQQAGMMQDNLKMLGVIEAMRVLMRRRLHRRREIDVMVTVEAMKTTNKELKKQYGKVDIDKIERMQDEMADLMDIGNEINESISRSYDVPDEVDEDELDAELEALGEEMELEGSGWEGEGPGAIPSFLEDENTAVPDFLDDGPKKVKETAQ